jgi:hypothetical protein
MRKYNYRPARKRALRKIGNRTKERDRKEPK